MHSRPSCGPAALQTYVERGVHLSLIHISPGLRDAIQEGFVTVKSGRYVIPVKASQRQKVPGTLVQASSSGMTVFIEPAQVQPLVDELITLRALEEDLVYKVLALSLIHI